MPELPGQTDAAEGAHSAEGASAPLDLAALASATSVPAAERAAGAASAALATELAEGLSTHADRFVDGLSEQDVDRLLAHCSTMLAQAKKVQWVNQRFSSYLGRCDLILSITLAAIPSVTAAVHSLMTIEHFEHSHTVMAALAGLQTMLVGLNSQLKFGHRLTEARLVSAGFESVVSDLQVAVSGTLTKTELKERARACEQKVKDTLALSNNNTPQWVIEEAEEVLGSL
jgi:hypothetical protein